MTAVVSYHIWVFGMVNMLEAVIVWPMVLGMVTKPMVFFVDEIVV